MIEDTSRERERLKNYWNCLISHRNVHWQWNTQHQAPTSSSQLTFETRITACRLNLIAHWPVPPMSGQNLAKMQNSHETRDKSTSIIVMAIQIDQLNDLAFFSFRFVILIHSRAEMATQFSPSRFSAFRVESSSSSHFNSIESRMFWDIKLITWN